MLVGFEPATSWPLWLVDERKILNHNAGSQLTIEVLRNTNRGHRTNPSNGSRFVHSNWSSHWYNTESKPGRKLPCKFWYKFKFKIINCFTADSNHTNESQKRRFYTFPSPEKKKCAFEMWTSMQVLSLPVVMVVDFAERRCHFHLEISFRSVFSYLESHIYSAVKLSFILNF